MRAVQLVKFGEPREALRYTDLPSGSESRRCPYKIEAAGVCGRDLVIRKGAFPHVKPPVTPGHEGVGRVMDVGPGVEKDIVGAGFFFRRFTTGRVTTADGGLKTCVETLSY